MSPPTDVSVLPALVVWFVHADAGRGGVCVQLNGEEQSVHGILIDVLCMCACVCVFVEKTIDTKNES